MKNKKPRGKHKKIFLFILIFIVILLTLIFGPTIYKIIEVKVYQRNIASFYSNLPSDLSDKRPGDVLKIEEMKNPVVGGKAYRILYVSQLPDEKLVPVSGLIFVSNKEAESRNIVAWAHGTVGLGSSCAPSKALTPTANLEPWLSMMMDKGYIVVATDYAGLGVEGSKEYLVGKSEGRDVLNSIRAAKSQKQFNPGEKAAIFGHSQGGHSAIFAANLNESYAKDVDLVGVVAAAPAVELNSLFSTQYDKPLVWAIAPEIYVSWMDKYNLPLDVIDSGMTAKKNEQIANLCIATAGAKAIFKSKLGEKYFINNPTQNKAWYDAFESETPKPVLKIPIMVMQGLTDTVVLPETTALFVKKSCSAGSNLSSFWYKNVGHVELPNVTSDDSVDWISNRFDGNVATSNCSIPTPVTPSAVISPPSN